MATSQRPPPELPVVALAGRVDASEIASVCKRVRGLICDQGADAVVVDVSGVIEPDLTALDALARLHLMARRFGREIKISHTCEQLEELAAFSGLGDVLCVKDERQAKEREVSGRVQEETDAGDLTV